MKIAMAQINPTVGALRDNGRKVAEKIKEARAAGAQLVVFPEMVITGYPTCDLMFEEGFVTENIAVLMEDIVPVTEGISAVVGFIGSFKDSEIEEGKIDRANCAAVISNGALVKTIKKTVLPGYDVFDEKRYFEPGGIEGVEPVLIESDGVKISLGVQICEDLWGSDKYGLDVTGSLAQKGASLIVNINASPFFIEKAKYRESQVVKEALRNRVPIVYVNLVGGQDELVFDGRSFAVDAEGGFIARAPIFQESLTIFDLPLNNVKPIEVPPVDLPWQEEVVQAHVLNLRDYVGKQGVFKGVVVGSSGGIDSAYTLFIATRAIGAENVLSVSMPSRFSSDHSLSDSAKLAENLGVRHLVIPIEDMFKSGLATFERAFGSLPFDVAEENDQARCRMQILMKISMKFKYLVCTTGNKSELSVGYWTLYGDGGGGKNIPGDLFKTELYEIVRMINKEKEIIPWNIISKPPSAELAPDQFDTDSLPPYEVLDPILALLVEERRRVNEIIALGNDAETVRRVARLYKNSEFKRCQMPQGIKVKRKSFGLGRRMPITNLWKL